MNIARFKDAAFMNLGELSQELILVGGVGGIGSATVLSLGKSLGGIPTIYILDNDRVESHNIGTQFFNEADVGNYKVYSLQSSMLSLGIKNINPIAHKYDNEITPIMISAFDNMEARKQMFNIWKNSEKRELFIDGRLRANLYEVYIVTKGREEEFEKLCLMMQMWMMVHAHLNRHSISQCL